MLATTLSRRDPNRLQRNGGRRPLREQGMQPSTEPARWRAHSLFMSKRSSDVADGQLSESRGQRSRTSGASEAQEAAPRHEHAGTKPARPRWRERLQRELLKVWLLCSAAWIACILAIAGQCVYGRWFGWRLTQCDAPPDNATETYLADLAAALGPPAALLLGYRVVMGVSKRIRQRR